MMSTTRVQHSGRADEAQIEKLGSSHKVGFGVYGKPDWLRNLHSYEEKVAIHFSSEEDLDYLIDMIWTENDLSGMPHVPAGDNTMIVPHIALDIIKRKLVGKSFVCQQVVNPRNLPPQKFTLLQQERNSLKA